MTPTAARLRWLQELETKGISQRGRTRVGFDCMQAGWTEWNYTDATGANMTYDEAMHRYGGRYWDHTRINGERLTATGRQVLATHGSASASR